MKEPREERTQLEREPRPPSRRLDPCVQQCLNQIAAIFLVDAAGRPNSE